MIDRLKIMINANKSLKMAKNNRWGKMGHRWGKTN